MSLSQMRPAWLTSLSELERSLAEKNPQMNLSQLRANRTTCPLVKQLLDDSIPPGQTPSFVELQLARTHLAMDLQVILKKWCEEGLKETLEGIFGVCIGDVLGRHNRTDARGEFQQFSLSSPQSTSFIFKLPGNSGTPECSTGLVDGRYPSIPLKRPPEDDEDDAPNMKSPKLYGSPTSAIAPEKDFRCPYNTMDPNVHPECAGKIYPNPRKLKEHVWRFTKPFKCTTCGEGFGREKTRAIHCEQRKVKCVDAPSQYEGSSEQRRDQRIESSKSTKEMVDIFKEFEAEASASQACQKLQKTSGVADGCVVVRSSEMESPPTDASAAPEEDLSMDMNSTQWPSETYPSTPSQSLATSPSHQGQSPYLMPQPNAPPEHMEIVGDNSGLHFTPRRHSISNTDKMQSTDTSLSQPGNVNDLSSWGPGGGLGSQGNGNTLLAVYPSGPRPQSAPPETRPFYDAQSMPQPYQQNPPSLSLQIPDIIVTHPESPALTGLSPAEFSPFATSASPVGYQPLSFNYSVESQGPELQLNGSEMQLDQHPKPLSEIGPQYDLNLSGGQGMPTFGADRGHMIGDEPSPTSPVVPIISQGWGAFQPFHCMMRASSKKRR